MKTWVYLFSKFTPEILYGIGLFLCLLGCGYTAFWVLRKRRYGSADAWVPAGPIRQHLNQLISDAQNLRIQLFGLLTEVDLSTHQDSSQTLIQLEAKLAEQTKLIHQITQEKAALERKLSNHAATLAAVPQKPSQTAPSITQPRTPTTPATAAVSPPSAAATTAPTAPIPTTPPVQAAPVKTAPVPPPVTTATPTPTAAPSQQTAPTPPAAALDTTSTAAVATAATPLADTSTAPATDIPTDAAQNTPPTLEANGKSEADLVAEFEKILKG